MYKLIFFLTVVWSVGTASAVIPIITVLSSSYSDVSCRPVAVIDGDTFVCLTADQKQLKVRLVQIDAPEKSQAYGGAAQKVLSSLILQKPVRLSVRNKDRYGRLLATTFVDGKNVNRIMVAAGYAWAYRKYLLSMSEMEVYLALESTARLRKHGLWADGKPVYPAEFRRKNHE